MSSPKLHRTSREPADSEQVSRRNVQPAANDFRSPEELKRWADLVANAEVAFPENLTAEGRAQLVEQVRRRRRFRLVQYIARAIAMDIAHEREPKQGG